MSLKYITGDCFSTPAKIIVHGCNNKGKFASGFAGAVRSKYPRAYETYMTEYNKHGLELGQVIFVPYPDITIVNGITQDGYGYDGRCYVKYDAINKVMAQTVQYAKQISANEVAMPLIGSGLGGGSWKTISEIIENNFSEIDALVYLQDGNIPES